MSEENNYAESPYVASKTALLARQKRDPIFDSVSPVTSSSPSIHTSFQKQHQQNIQSHQHSINTHQQHTQHFPYPTQQASHHQQQHHQQQQHQQPQHHHQNTQQQQHHHQLFQHPVIETTQSSSTFNQLDKENRLFNSNATNNSSIISKLQQSMSTSKSNAIFDRFDIINSEKPHRFKV